MHEPHNVYSHLHLKLLHIFASNDIKNPNQTKQENFL